MTFIKFTNISAWTKRRFKSLASGSLKYNILYEKSFAECGKGEIVTRYFGSQFKNYLSLIWTAKTQIMICLWLFSPDIYWKTIRYYFNHMILFLLSNNCNKPYEMGKQTVVFNMFTDEQIFTVEFVKHLKLTKRHKFSDMSNSNLENLRNWAYNLIFIKKAISVPEKLLRVLHFQVDC